MRLHRFYVSQPLGEEVVIDDVSKIKQWAKVFRYTKGDFVILFNGEGIDVTYTIETISSTSSTLLRTKQTTSIVPTRNVTLYLSIIKKDNFELVVQKVTELGVTTIIPILSDRSEKKNLSFERLQTIAIEALEQSGRGDTVTIKPITTLIDAIIQANQGNSWILQMNGTPVLQAHLNTNESVSLFIGPEGGWSDNELELFKNKGFKSVSLGNTVLRAETAAIAACAFASI